MERIKRGFYKGKEIKKILLPLLLVLLLSTASAQNVERKVLVEHITNSSVQCPTCPVTDPISYSLLNQNNSKVIWYTVHESNLYDPIWTAAKVANDDRIDELQEFMSNDSSDNRIDGGILLFTQKSIDSEYAVKPILSINMSKRLSNDSVYVTVDVKILSDYIIKAFQIINMDILVAESISYYNPANYPVDTSLSNHESTFPNVLRGIYDSSELFLSKDTLHTGDDMHYNTSFSLTNFQDINNLRIIAFVEEGNTSNPGVTIIHNAASIEPDITTYVTSHMGENDITIFPNPTNDNVTIMGKYDMAYVYDIAGKLVIETNVKSISLPNAGLYIFKLVSGNDVTYTKIVKQ